MSMCVVGSINADLVVHTARHPKPGETLLGHGGEITAGGKGANQAVAAALLGAPVTFVGAVGSDAYAAPAMRYLEASGVNLEHVARTDEVTGLAVITVDGQGENTIIVVPGANALVDAPFVTAHSSPITESELVLLQGEIPADGFAKAVELATSRVVINLAPVVKVDRDALLKADPLLANEHEAGLILEQLGLSGEGAPAQLAQRLREAGFASVVLTLGAKGALVAEGTSLVAVPSPQVTAVDTTGAGDAFAGALCARLLKGDSLVEAARYAARVGAFAVTGAGAQASYPDRDTELPS
ncbi:ribokinase [Corynebacterium sp. FDAARGOS 1242]|uniref:ribokinase n=1 Tax=unclassified Corynebacterium TaxID=2624378 RepID=UPI0008A3071A|nr:MULTISPECIES: ribokinase [unclassified Corynebacterium]OFR63702.1 ribokinase [Corynebacterium sp. HMSC078H07]QRP97220.1 ribokinase [Corynebacterium sp. FDAARGOS 1242]